MEGGDGVGDVGEGEAGWRRGESGSYVRRTEGAEGFWEREGVRQRQRWTTERDAS